MPRELSSQEKRLLILAQKKGRDGELYLLDELHALEATLERMTISLKNEIAELKDRVSPSSQEIKAVLEQTEKMMNIFSGVERLKGDTGEKGEQGIKGDKGDMGEQGEKGEQGKLGERGEKGDIGEKGETGKDGSSDTPQQIADKLNTLPEVVEQGTIKGLKDEIEKLKKRITAVSTNRTMGGIARNQMRTNSFSFDGDGATTSFLLPAVPDGKGTLIWIYYGGQWLQPSVHFTIANRTLNLTFAPSPATKIEGFLIRML